MKDLFDFLKSFDLHTIITVGVAFWWLNSSMNTKLDVIQKDIISVKTEMNDFKTDIAVIKTVLLMKEMASSHNVNKEIE